LARGILTFRIDRCKGCELCVSVCPQNILALDQENVNVRDYHPIHCVEPARCIGCGNCGLICPDGVIQVFLEEVRE
jgi:2-oxoglutarate ferredoxin oxidoreductase subunit delta